MPSFFAPSDSPTAMRLSRIFRRVAPIALVPATLAACGSGVSRSGFDQNVCTQEGRKPLVGVRFAQTFDYVELREVGGGSGSGTAPRITDSIGEKCKTATDASACARAYDTLDVGEGWNVPTSGDVVSRHVLVTTAGDTVAVVKSVLDLDKLVSPVESVANAALVVEERGYRFDCASDPSGRVNGANVEVVGRTGTTCGGNVYEHLLRVGKDATFSEIEKTVVEKGDSNCAIGRRPTGVVFAHGGPSRGAVADWFVRAAALEEASIVAFERLAVDLERIGAPASLVDRARVAAEDERRHTDLTKRLAARFGGVPVAPTVPAHEAKSLLALAVENAVEGCVRETFGALTAHVQSERAMDPKARAAFGVIAREETEHAALAWDLHAWFESALAPEAFAAVEEARKLAILALEGELAASPGEVVHAVLGVPEESEARSMLFGLERHLWAA
ncbi:MAG: ferritin-like domain-containing protein [Polyangiaceae bacterium]